jgi:hypothetical protein
MKAELIKIDGTRTTIVPKNGTDFTLSELYNYIDCDMIEVVRVGKRILVVDESGLLKRKSKNATASMLASNYIVGDVVLCDDDMVR